MDFEKDNIKRICILCMGLLGDVLMRTPIIREIKKTFKDSYIVCIADQVGAEILSLNDDVDELIVIHRSRQSKLKYFVSKLETQYFILTNSFDLMIDLYGGKSSNNMMNLNFVYYKVGFVDGKPWSNRLSYKESSKFSNNTYHLTNHSFKIMNFFNVDYNNSTIPTVKTRPYDDAKMLDYFSSFNNESIFLISLGSGGVEKILDFEKQCYIAKYIYSKYKLVPAIVSNPGQEYLQNDFIDNYLTPSKIPHIKLKTLTLSEISSMMLFAKFIIVPDTGLYHIAVALGIPMLVFFTYTNPKLVLPESGIIEFCFNETANVGSNNLPYGDNQITHQNLKESLDKLMKKLSIKDRENNLIS